ncbi:MAG: 50S ribosome-binding GTPase, partial [Sedimentisphaerales bacterium]|nr:50S ribosome-binding GTPase [Sedimentisphaerales bacterium]
MTTSAAVLTGGGIGAIATIQVFGPNAFDLAGRCCRPVSGRPIRPKVGQVRLVHIYDGDDLIDQALIGYEDQDLVAIHCHGSPLIVQSVMRLLARLGAELVGPRSLLARYHTSKGLDAIQTEARLALLDAQTKEAAMLIQGQILGGLHKQVRSWLSMDIRQIQQQAHQLLIDSGPGWRLLYGIRAGIVGPPNSGKSSIFNALLRQQRAVVSDQPGTTRDPVRSTCQISPLVVELIDTAPLGPDPDDPLQAVACQLT